MGVAEESVEPDDDGSSMGGKGRSESSGRGL